MCCASHTQAKPGGTDSCRYIAKRQPYAGEARRYRLLSVQLNTWG